MINIINKYIRKSTPKSMVHWRQHLDSLNMYQMEHLRRFQLSPGFESGAVRLLRHVLNFVDYNALKKYKDDYKRYTQYISHISEDLDNIFDPVRTGRSFHNLFIDKSSTFATSEYLFPVEDIDHLKLLPFNEPFDSWKELRPVVLWTHDSNELSQHLLEDRLKFKYIQPTNSVFFIDVITLTFMYYKYVETLPPQMHQWAAREFIHKYVISKLYEDSLDVWITQRIGVIANCESLDEVKITCRSAISNMDNRYGYVGGRFEEASEELFKEIELVKQGNNTISSLFSSKLYTRGSILDRIEYQHTWLEVPAIRQYDYVRVLRDISYLTIIVGLYKHITNISDTQAFIRDIKQTCRKMITSNFYSSIKNPVTRTMVKEHFEKLVEELLRFNV